MEEKIVYLGLGTNRGDKPGNLERAINLIAERTGNIFSRSSVYITEPWGFSDDEYFLNQVVGVKTAMEPMPLLISIKEIENGLGRHRTGTGYQPRTIDIDILFYNDLISQTSDLKIPHPLLHERKFVLIPLAEIAGENIHPVYKKSVHALLAECQDQSNVEKLT